MILNPRICAVVLITELRLRPYQIKNQSEGLVFNLVNPRVLTWKQIQLALALMDQLLIDAGLQLEATHATTISN